MPGHHFPFRWYFSLGWVWSKWDRLHIIGSDVCVCVYTLDIRSSMAVEPTSTNTRSSPPISVDSFFQPYLLASEYSVEKQT
jgi:hypothetical protein